MLQAGKSEEEVAIFAVAARNALKVEFRVGMDADDLAAIEARNLYLYGDPVGPTPAAQLKKYGNWSAVIDAACRHAKLLK